MAKSLELKAIFRAIDKMTGPLNKIQRRIRVFAKRARAAMKRVNVAVSRLTRVLATGLKWGFAAAAGAALGLWVAITKTAGAMDDLAKMSRRLEFDIEALQEWGFVAEQSGLGAEKFQQALGKFTKNIGDAKAGTGTLTTLLRKMDPALLKQLKNTNDTSQAFEQYITALRNVKDPMERAALAQAGFGRVGLNLINISKLSAQEIEGLRKEMRNNGIVTLETAQKAEAFNDALNSFKLSVRGLLFDALGPLFPELQTMLRSMREWTIANREVIKGQVVAFVRRFLITLKQLVSWFRKLQEQHSILEKLEKGFKFIGRAIEFVIANGDGLAKLAGIVLSIVVAVKALNLAIEVFNLLASLNPWSALLIGIAAALVFVYAHWNQLNAAVEGILFQWAIWFKEIKITIMETIGGAINWAVEKLNAVRSFFGAEPIKWEFDVGDFTKEAKSQLSALKEVQMGISFDEAAVKDEAKLINRLFRGLGNGGGISDIVPQMGIGLDKTESSINPSSQKRGADKQLVTHSSMVHKSLEERMHEESRTERAEVVIRDETGRAQVSKNLEGGRLKVQRTGAF